MTLQTLRVTRGIYHAGSGNRYNRYDSAFSSRCRPKRRCSDTELWTMHAACSLRPSPGRVGKFRLLALGAALRIPCRRCHILSSCGRWHIVREDGCSARFCIVLSKRALRANFNKNISFLGRYIPHPHYSNPLPTWFHVSEGMKPFRINATHF